MIANINILQFNFDFKIESATRFEFEEFYLTRKRAPRRLPLNYNCNENSVTMSIFADLKAVFMFHVKRTGEWMHKSLKACSISETKTNYQHFLFKEFYYTILCIQQNLILFTPSIRNIFGQMPPHK